MLWPCRAVARIVVTFDLQSTSGPLLHARVRCDAGHVAVQLFEEVDLLG